MLKVAVFTLFGIVFQQMLIQSHATDTGDLNLDSKTCDKSEDDCGCSKLRRDQSQGNIQSTNYDSKATNSEIPPGSKSQSPYKRTDQMVLISAGEFNFGTNKPIFIGDGEGPARLTKVNSLYVDVHEVSNAEFELFVNQTAYVTEAEKFGNSFVLEALLSDRVKSEITQAVASAPWWLPVANADWRHPEGIDSSIKHRMNHPVVHVSWNDAAAYCKWKSGRLPTEAEWEYACKAGLEDRLYPWGNNLNPKGEHMMNVWQGDFPHQDTGDDGYAGTAPVTAYPVNKFGLKNVVGNVWEWTADWWAVQHIAMPEENPKGPESGTDKVKKGGSFMCTKKFCYRHRCAARSQNTPDSSSVNLGFRCVKDVETTSHEEL